MKKHMFFALALLCANFCNVHSNPLVVSGHVDPQQGFTEHYKGSLAVPGTDEYFIKVYNVWAEFVKKRNIRRAITQDFHTQENMSFASNWKTEDGKPVAPFTVLGTLKNPKPKFPYKNPNLTQVLWPDHCAQGTESAYFFISICPDDIVVPKGMDRDHDSYSGFEDDGGKKTGLEVKLKKIKTTTVIWSGLCTDICVKATDIDGAKAGFHGRILLTACRGLDKKDTIAALKLANDLGIEIDHVVELDTRFDAKLIRDLKKANVTVNIYTTLNEYADEVESVDAQINKSMSVEKIYAENKLKALEVIALKAKQLHN